MEEYGWEQPVCDQCGELLEEDDYYGCDQCNGLFCGCWYESCQQNDCDFSSCTQCMDEHRSSHEPESSDDAAALMYRALLGLREGLRQMRDAMSQSEDQINQRLDQMENDVRWINNLDAIDIARDQVELIADQLALNCPRQLHRREIIELSLRQDNSDIPAEDLRNFQRANLILEATDDKGTMQYLTVEAAFVASTKHALRAMTNADFLTRFTTLHARAVIAAVRVTAEIQSDIDNETLF